MSSIVLDILAEVMPGVPNPSVLHHAAQSGQIGTIRLLVASGANARAENTLNETPADLAPQRLRSRVVAALSNST